MDERFSRDRLLETAEETQDGWWKYSKWKTTNKVRAGGEAVISTVGEFTKWRSVDGSFSTTPLAHIWLHCTEEGGRQLSSGELVRPKPKPLASGVDKQKAATGRTQAADRRALRSCGTLLCRLTKRCPACVPTTYVGLPSFRHYYNDYCQAHTRLDTRPEVALRSLTKEHG
jgi:hypothetical protein